MNEAAFQKRCVKKSKDRGWLAYKFSSPAHRGVPDMVFIKQGKVVFIEFKAPNGGGRVTPLQHKTIFDMTVHGASVHVVSSEEKFDAVIR